MSCVKMKETLTILLKWRPTQPSPSFWSLYISLQHPQGVQHRMRVFKTG